MTRPTLALLLATALTATLPSCGTLLFDERTDDHSGRVDPNVVVLDGLGLLFFLLPGVIAFVVDHHTGALYLPNGVERGEGPFFED